MLSLSVLGLWSLGFLWMLSAPEVSSRWLLVSLIGPAYYLVASVALNLPRAQRGAPLP